MNLIGALGGDTPLTPLLLLLLLLWDAGATIASPVGVASTCVVVPGGFLGGFTPIPPLCSGPRGAPKLTPAAVGEGGAKAGKCAISSWFGP